MTTRTDERIRRTAALPGSPSRGVRYLGAADREFRRQLEAAVELAPVAPDQIDVVLWDGPVQTHIGSFIDGETAERHRQAVIDAVISAKQRAAAA